MHYDSFQIYLPHDPQRCFCNNKYIPVSIIIILCVNDCCGCYSMYIYILPIPRYVDAITLFRFRLTSFCPAAFCTARHRGLWYIYTVVDDSTEISTVTGIQSKYDSGVFAFMFHRHHPLRIIKFCF